MSYFLAFSYNLHDSSVSIADDERVLLVLEAERYFGTKKMACTRPQMEELAAAALRYCRIPAEAIAGVACTAYRNEHLPEGERDCAWKDEKRVEILGRSFDARVINHHLAHAAIVHAFPGVRDVAIDICDGGGDFGDTHKTYRYRDGRIEELKNQPIHDAFSSRFYDVMSRHIYRRLMCEGKLMALASLGEPRPEMTEYVRRHLYDFHHKDPEEMTGILNRDYPVDDYQRSRTAFDLAAATQRVFEELRLESVRALPSNSEHVLLGGGASLNILANTRVKTELGDERGVLVPPCCDDTGQSLGALLSYCHEDLRLPITANMPFLGMSDSIADSRLSADDVSGELIDFLVDGGIVFLHRGQSEIGPRALGHRSIIALPDRKNHDLINHVIKGREFYRPLAPIVPRERVSDWFDWDGESKYMLYGARALDRTRLAAEGICHYDGTARIQTVSASEDPFLHAVLERVGEATGTPILINTSLNPRGLPISSGVAETRAFLSQVSGLGVRMFHEGELQGE